MHQEPPCHHPPPPIAACPNAAHQETCVSDTPEPQRHLKSVRRDAERGGRDARAPQRHAERRCNTKWLRHKDVAGEGADHLTRGKQDNK